jgi:hypothetical protein
VAALVKKGLVASGRSPGDRRRLTLTLTAAGEAEAGRAAGWPDFLAAVAEDLPAAEQGALLRLLVRLLRELQERGAVPVARMCVTCRFFHPHAHPDPERPHHCASVDAPFGDRHLRIDCPEQEPAAAGAAAASWAAFAVTR